MFYASVGDAAMVYSGDYTMTPDRHLGAAQIDRLCLDLLITDHLDHIGALPYFTEVCGYNGPIYMTYPTKALAPLMLDDYRKVMVGRGEEEQFSNDNILNCMKKVTTVDIKQTVQIDKDLQIRAYYAGHVLGAAMFYASVGDAAMVYTGDYTMTPDRHLGAAQIDRLCLDLITESTYGKLFVIQNMRVRGNFLRLYAQVMRTQMVDLEARLEERKVREELQQQFQEFMKN